MGGHELDSSGAEQGQIVGSCEYGNDPYGSIKCREFLEKLMNSVSQEVPCFMQLVSIFRASWSHLRSSYWKFLKEGI
jgi:hypothetical protein